MSPVTREAADGPVEFRSATDTLKLLRNRKIGAVELLKFQLDRVQRHNPSINAIVAMDVDGALAAAQRADDLAPSDLPLLHGLPMTIKDSFEVTGMPATCGLPFLAGHRPQRDADPVARLKAQGAIVFGKTNLPPGAFDWQSYNLIYGITTNPWDRERTPGGSSGGSAAAVAAGLSFLELGSDIGGSIRTPAHFCGVYGHKPSFGVVPLRGHIPPLPGHEAPIEMGVGGPLARSAADLELALDILVAPSERERTAWSVGIPASRHERLQDFRVAMWADDSAYAVDARCLAAMHAYADDLRRLGVKVDMVARPDIDPRASYEAYLMTVLPMMGSGLPPEAIRRLVDSAAGMAPDSENYVARAARAVQLRLSEQFAVAEQRERLYSSWRDFFGRHDLLICPAMPTVAYPTDRRGDDATDPISAGEHRSIIVNGQHRPYFDNLQWPSLATVANLPATAVPTGRYIDGVPMGVQVIGPYLEDRTPLRFAQLVEHALGGFQAPPAFMEAGKQD